jgi:16S rRNA processing protein RimM
VSDDALKFVSVGRVKDAHGLKGEIFIVLYSGEAAWLKQLKTLRLRPPRDAAMADAAGASPIEAVVKAARLHKNGLIVLSPDIIGRTAAERLRGFELEIPETFLVSKPGESIYLREILGFGVATPQAGSVGRIVAFSSNGAQDLLIVRTARGDFPIPFVAPLVLGIDYEAKQIEMEIPQGLLGDGEAGEDDASGSASGGDETGGQR